MREEIVSFINEQIPDNYRRMFWILLPCTVILFPISWVFFGFIQYFAGIELVGITQLIILISSVCGFIIGFVTYLLINETDLSLKYKTIVMILAFISTIFCPLVFAVAGFTVNLIYQ